MQYSEAVLQSGENQYSVTSNRIPRESLAWMIILESPRSCESSNIKIIISYTCLVLHHFCVYDGNAFSWHFSSLSHFHYQNLSSLNLSGHQEPSAIPCLTWHMFSSTFRTSAQMTKTRCFPLESGTRTALAGGVMFSCMGGTLGWRPYPAKYSQKSASNAIHWTKGT